MVTKSRMLTAAFLVSIAAAQAAAQEAEQKADILFGKLEAAISRVDCELDGVMGMAAPGRGFRRGRAHPEVVTGTALLGTALPALDLG